MPSLVETAAIPLVGPFTLHPETSLSLNRYLFYVFSGLREQSFALVDFASHHLRMPDSSLILLYPAGEELAEIMDEVEKHCGRKGSKRYCEAIILPAVLWRRKSSRH